MLPRALAIPEFVLVVIGEIVADVREGLLAMTVGTGLQVMVAMMEADVAAGPGCGTGSERGSVTLGAGCPSSGQAAAIPAATWIRPLRTS